MKPCDDGFPSFRGKARSARWSASSAVQRPLLSIIVLGVLILTMVLPARADDSYLRIAVRSDVEQAYQGWGKAPLKSHGKVYYLMSVKETDPVKGLVQAPLVKPVNDAGVRKVLVGELAKQGFREMSPSETPDILLTVVYGRGFLENPYMKGQVVGEDLRVVVSGFDSTNNVADSRNTTYQDKLQIASLEKLFVRVTAWAYPDPTKGKQKPKMLWKTTVMIEEPDHRDLNQFLAKMLAAAAPYFDHKTNEAEAIVDTTVPEGYVRYGETKVVEPAPAGK